MNFVAHLLQLIRSNPNRTPRGYYLLRYYKISHRDRVMRALSQAQIEDAVSIRDVEETAPGKFAIYCRCDCREAEGLFFQHYALIKQEERSQAGVRARVA